MLNDDFEDEVLGVLYAGYITKRHLTATAKAICNIVITCKEVCRRHKPIVLHSKSSGGLGQCEHLSTKQCKGKKCNPYTGHFEMRLESYLQQLAGKE